MLRRYFSLAALFLFLGACNVVEDTAEADAAISVFHADYNAKNYDGIWLETSDTFRNVTSEKEFTNILQSAHAILGKVINSERSGWKSEITPQGTFLIISQSSKYENGSGTEIFTFEKTDNGSNLAGYSLNSDDLLAGMTKRTAEAEETETDN